MASGDTSNPTSDSGRHNGAPLAQLAPAKPAPIKGPVQQQRTFTKAATAKHALQPGPT